MSLDFYLQYHCDGNDIQVFDRGITHNLAKMAKEAGVYEALWEPSTISAVKAEDIIYTLEVGLSKLKRDRKHFEKFNAENGWGLYEHFVPFVEDVLNACYKYPSATILVSR